MNEEITRILKMVEDGKLTADKAKTLMDALGQEETAVIIKPTNYEDQYLRVKVNSQAGDMVNVQLPIKVIKEVLKVTGKLPVISEKINGTDIDIEQMVNTIISCLNSEVMGEIVNISSANGDTVKIVIE